ncbi:MAG: ribonuclease J [Anaerolineaceae bacterium]|nr:ribonuclease J [Anaerolineaceae bacterium]
MKSKTLKVIPLGGLGEVGKNMTVYEYNGQLLIVDAGMMFPNNNMIGVDYIIPDFEYVKAHANQVCGIVITHGHEDHIGAISYLLDAVDAPVYGTALTIGLIKSKLNRRKPAHEPKLQTVNAGESIQIGPFKVKLFHVCHSMPDCVGLGIETPAGLIVQTGDYKFDHTPVDGWPTDYAALAEFAQKGVLALLSDSTNAERPGWTPSEKVIDAAFDKAFAKAKGRIIIATFASLISRVQQAYDCAVRYGRKVAFGGTSMLDNISIAQELGYVKFDPSVIVSMDTALTMPDSKVLLVVTGSQGEPLSILGRLANGTNKKFGIKPSDTVILSSYPIPGNEEPVYHAINKLMERGAEVIYGAVAPVHVSGHPSQEEIKLLLHLTRPRYLIPVHGELRMLRMQAKLGLEVGMKEEDIAIVENGRVIEFTNRKMKLGERIPGGYVFVDGTMVGDIDRETIREREQLSNEGVLVVNLLLDPKDPSVWDLQMQSRGFIGTEEEADLLAALKERVRKILISPSNNLQRELFNAARNTVYDQTHRQPIVFATVAYTS